MIEKIGKLSGGDVGSRMGTGTALQLPQLVYVTLYSQLLFILNEMIFLQLRQHQKKSEVVIQPEKEKLNKPFCSPPLFLNV